MISSSSEGEIEHIDVRPQQNECASFICDKLSDAIYGKVYHGTVLRRSSPTDSVCQMTTSECAIKFMTWERIRKGSGHNQTENPQDEIAAMQHIMRHTYLPSLATLASEWEKAGQAPSNELKIRKCHLNVAPFSSIIQPNPTRLMKRLQNSRNKPKRSQIHRTQVLHRYQNIHRHSKKG